MTRSNHFHCETFSAAIEHARAVSSRVDGRGTVYGDGFGYLVSNRFLQGRQPLVVFRSGVEFVPQGCVALSA